MYQHQVKLPHGYFEKAKNEYSDWKFSWWRGVIQNAIEAGAKNIKLAIEDYADNKLLLTCQDDGSGMTEDALVDVFLALGETDGGAEKTGSFGYAKAIILFAHDSYEIKTNDIVVRGHSGAYSINKSNEVVHGTEIKVVIDAPASSSIKAALKDRLTHFIHYSSFDQDVNLVVDNVPHSLKDIQYDYEVITDLGQLSFSDGSPDASSKLMIRANGLVMFNHVIYMEGQMASFCGVLDLDKPSIDILTSNRDGLKSQYGQILNKIISVLSQERTILKCQDLIDFTFNEDYQDQYELSLEQADLAASMPEARENKQGTILSYMALKHLGLGLDNVPLGTEFVGNPFKKYRAKADNLVGQVEARFNRIDQHLYPSNFKIKTHKMQSNSPKKKYFDIIKLLDLKRTQKMAWMWDFIVFELLKTSWAESHNVIWRKNRPEREGMLFRTGFIFSDHVEGLKVKNDQEYCILINILSLDDDYDFEDMLDQAISQVAHIVAPYHQEYFSMQESALRKSMRKRMKTRLLEKYCLEKIKSVF